MVVLKINAYKKRGASSSPFSCLRTDLFGAGLLNAGCGVELYPLQLGHGIEAGTGRLMNDVAREASPGSAIAVDAAITSGRLLTGGDLDIESVRRDRNGNLWFGEEFGPFLVKTDAGGTVQKVIQTPNVLGLGSNPQPNSLTDN